MSFKVIDNFVLRLKLKVAYWKASANDFVVPNNERKRCFFFLAADYGNLGDVAITYAQTKFLCERFPNAEIVEIPISKTFAGIKAVRSIISKDDIITIVGGGNMGDMYDDIEFLRQLVIQKFSQNRIISFPQTFDFSKTLSGQIALKTAKRVYSSHKNLTILARESVSYYLMQHHFNKNNVILVPDIVMTLDERQPEEPRKGITLCLRNDSERKFDIRDEVVGLLESAGIEYSDYDTHIGRGNLSMEERVSELNLIWTQFSRSELIITDRLHGMIFAFITSTPALVISNSNHKIRSSYEWIKDCGYVNYQNTFDMLTIIKKMQTENIDLFESIHSNIIKQYDENFPKE